MLHLVFMKSEPNHTMDSEKDKSIIIQGVTEAGKTFRPSDWAERMSGNLSTFKNHRVYYSPLLRPAYKDGHKCVIVDPTLKQTNPALYKSIMAFAQSNNLKICKEDDQ